MLKLNTTHVQALGQNMARKPELFQMSIKAKNVIQMTVLPKITILERIMLSKNIVTTSLKEKVIGASKEYWKHNNSTDEIQLYAVALAVGTILKEIDNGNTEYVTNEGILNVMNQLKNKQESLKIK